MAPIDLTDLDDALDSDDEGEVPPLLGPSCSSTPTVPAKPAAVPKAAPPDAIAKAEPAKPVPSTAAPKPGSNLKASSGLKKGFLGGGGGGSARPNKAAPAGSSTSSDGGIPMVRAAADAKQKSLQLPEVQDKIEAEKAEAAKLASPKNSWMTPELLQKIAAKPILRKAFTDPKCQQAMTEMQTDPQAAMKKYGDVPEMREFLQAFMKLMGDHFTELADKQEKEQKEKLRQAEAMLTPEERKSKEVAEKAMQDPEVRTIVQDPKIQALLQNMQSGKSFELERAAREDPDVVRKLRKLSEAGLIGMHFER